MKRFNNPSFLIPLLCLAAGRLSAQVVAGPIVNPANGHAYFLLAPNTWTSSESQAVALGGHLATINDPGGARLGRHGAESQRHS